jgi:TPP-dependent pyruvate/acetoin dehydrogenase alpha subunit
MKNFLVEKLYREALRIRNIELEISRRYSSNQIRCPVHLSVGQEGIAAACALVMKKLDFAVSTHRGHAHYLAKGGDLTESKSSAPSAADPLAGVDPHDPGVDIGGLLKLTGGWKQIK